MPSIGDRVKEIREERRFTQDQLAAKSDVSKGFLSDIENNKRNPSSEYVLKIANALGASLEYLLRGEEPQKPAHHQPVVIPRSLAEAAEQLNLSYSATIELLEAHDSVIARRSNRKTKPFEVADWVKLYEAIKGVFG